jgi:hypothetical protein
MGLSVERHGMAPLPATTSAQAVTSCKPVRNVGGTTKGTPCQSCPFVPWRTEGLFVVARHFGEPKAVHTEEKMDVMPNGHHEALISVKGLSIRRLTTGGATACPAEYAGGVYYRPETAEGE